MNTSLSWIKAYVPDLDVTAQEYTDAMTLSGTKVEGFEKLDADLDKIVIGQIDKIEKHPDADLSVSDQCLQVFMHSALTQPIMESGNSACVRKDFWHLHSLSDLRSVSVLVLHVRHGS